MMLERRPPTGIWGGLWCFPQCDFNEDIEKWCHERYGFSDIKVQCAQQFQHSFTHFRYLITPIYAIVMHRKMMVKEDNKTAWIDFKQPLTKGVAKPVEKILLEWNADLTCSDH